MNKGVEVLLFLLQREQLELLLKFFSELAASYNAGLIVDPSSCLCLRHHEDNEATDEPEEKEVSEGKRNFSEVNPHLKI